jgi:hypothetical protein
MIRRDREDQYCGQKKHPFDRARQYRVAECLVSLAPLFAFWSLVGVVTWRRRAT